MRIELTLNVGCVFVRLGCVLRHSQPSIRWRRIHVGAMSPTKEGETDACSLSVRITVVSHGILLPVFYSVFILFLSFRMTRNERKSFC